MAAAKSSSMSVKMSLLLHLLMKRKSKLMERLVYNGVFPTVLGVTCLNNIITIYCGLDMDSQA